MRHIMAPASRRAAYRLAGSGLQRQRVSQGHGRCRPRTLCARHCARSRTRRPGGTSSPPAWSRGSSCAAAWCRCLLTDRAHAAAMEPVRREVEALLARQPGVTNATAMLTAHKAGRRPRARGSRRRGAAAHGHGQVPAHGGAGAAEGRRCCCRR